MKATKFAKKIRMIHFFNKYNPKMLKKFYKEKRGILYSDFEN